MSLSDSEIRVAWQAFERIGWPFGRIAQLLLLTGARRDEIAGARWSEIDLEAKTWTIAKERSKNGVAHEIPLSDAAIQIIKSLPRIGGKGDGFVFTTTTRAPVSGWSRAKAHVDKAILADHAGVQERRRSPAHWTFHDLRRTAASGMAGIGIAPHVVEAVLNHKSGTIKGVAAVYNQLQLRGREAPGARRVGAAAGGDRQRRRGVERRRTGDGENELYQLGSIVPAGSAPIAEMADSGSQTR